MELFKNKAKLQVFRRVFLIIVGSFILGLGSGLFLTPYNIVSGGLSGIAVILHVLFNFNINLWIWILTFAFFFVGWIVLGTPFAAKTFLSSLVYPLSVMLGTYLYEYTPLNFGSITEITGSVNYLLAALFGGIFVGTGVGLTFLGGGSTGGVDVITLIITKYTSVKASVPSFIVDAVTILLGAVSGNSFSVTLMGIISAFVASLMVDKIFDSERNVVVNIISKNYEEINRFVLSKLDRGSTIIDGIGGYSQTEVKILQVALPSREYYVLQEIIAQVDPTAFVVVSKASSIRGEGFKAHTQSKKMMRRGKKNKDETTEV